MFESRAAQVGLNLLLSTARRSEGDELDNVRVFSICCDVCSNIMVYICFELCCLVVGEIFSSLPS